MREREREREISRTKSWALKLDHKYQPGGRKFWNDNRCALSLFGEAHNTAN